MTDTLGRPNHPPETKFKISEALAQIPKGKRGSMLVYADSNGDAKFQLAAYLDEGEHWKVAAGASYHLGEKRPAGYVAVEASW